MAKIINPYNIIINQDIPYAKAMIDTDIKYVGDIIIPEDITILRDNCFYGNSNLKGKLILHNNIISIGAQTCYRCTGLTGLVIGSKIFLIEYNNFYDCHGLLSIVVDSNNKFYDSRNNCNAIIDSRNNILILGCKNTIIPNTVKSIGDYAFYNVPLVNITIPDNVTSIGFSVFSGCYNLTKITMKPINPPTLANSSAIPDNDTLIIEVPSASLDAYKTATNWSIFADKMVGV